MAFLLPTNSWQFLLEMIVLGGHLQKSKEPMIAQQKLTESAYEAGPIEH